VVDLGDTLEHGTKKRIQTSASDDDRASVMGSSGDDPNACERPRIAHRKDLSRNRVRNARFCQLLKQPVLDVQLDVSNIMSSAIN